MEENLNELIEAEEMEEYEEVNFAESEEDAVEFAEEERGIVTVKVAKLNVRQSPDQSSRVLTIVTKGTQLVTFPEQSVMDWLKVLTPDNVEGYVMSSFVE